MGKRLRILLVDDDEDEYLLTQDLLSDRARNSTEGELAPFQLEWVSTFEDAVQAFSKKHHDVYLVDYHLGHRDGLQLLREAEQLGVKAPIILMTGQGSYALDVQAMKTGAADYLSKGELTAPLLERTIRYAIERKRNEAKLRESEQRLRLALGAAGMGTWDLNLDTEKIYYSANLQHSLGLTDGALPNNYRSFIEMIHPADRERVEEIFSTSLQNTDEENGYQIDFRVATESEPRWLHLRGRAITEGNGRAVRVMGVITDITQRKQAEEAIRKSAKRAELLASLSQVFAEASLDYSTIFSTVARQIGEIFGDVCIIRLLSDDGQWLDPVAYYHPNRNVLKVIEDRITSKRQSIDLGLSGQVFRKGQALLLPNALSEEVQYVVSPEYWEMLKTLPVQSALIVPLRARGRFFGTLGLLRLPERPPFTEEDKQFFQELVDRAALAIENSRLYNVEAQRVRELDALQRATAALLATIDLEDLLSHILDVAQGAFPVAEKGMLYLAAPETGQLQVRAVAGFHDPRIRRVSLPKNNDYPARAYQERRPLLIRDMLEDLNMGEVTLPPEMNTIRSGIIAPLILNDKVLGVLSLSSSRPAAFSESDLRLLVSFANTTTAAIQNAQLHSEVQMLAITDTLTEAYNRRGFFEIGQREFERAERFGRPLSAIMVDVDEFKGVNDTHGHAVGDQVLRILAQRIFTSIRDQDILGRYGGDEFAILLPETDMAFASIVAERIRKAVSAPFSIQISGNEQIRFQMTASLGVANSRNDTRDLNALIDRADRAAYVAKNKGRDLVEVG